MSKENNDLPTILLGLVLTVLGVIVIFVIGRAMLGFILDHWLITSVLIIAGVAVGLYFFLKD